MGKKRPVWNRNTFLKQLSEGRSMGTGKDYRPQITIHDIPSLGTCTRVKGRASGRVQHFLSDNELSFFYLQDFDAATTDIWEQFGLLDPDKRDSLYRIVELAENLGIRYPRDNKSKYPYVMTSDFVVVKKDGIHVFSVKESKDIQKKRVQELQLFEKTYWETFDFHFDLPVKSWKQITEKDINFQKASNIEWIYRSMDIDMYYPDYDLCRQVMEYLIDMYQNTILSICTICEEAEKSFGLGRGMGMTAFQRTLFERKLVIPLESRLDFQAVRIKDVGGMHSCLKVYM